MFTAILAALAAIPQILSEIRLLRAELNAHTKAVTDSMIAAGQRDMNAAETSEEIKKAAAEDAAALGRL